MLKRSYHRQASQGSAQWQVIGQLSPNLEDGEPFEARMQGLVAELHPRAAEGARLDAAIATNLTALAFGGTRGNDSRRVDRPSETLPR